MCSPLCISWGFEVKGQVYKIKITEFFRDEIEHTHTHTYAYTNMPFVDGLHVFCSTNFTSELRNTIFPAKRRNATSEVTHLNDDAFG